MINFKRRLMVSGYYMFIKYLCMDMYIYSCIKIDARMDVFFNKFGSFFLFFDLYFGNVK